jgi:hypothetical protein
MRNGFAYPSKKNWPFKKEKSNSMKTKIISISLSIATVLVIVVAILSCNKEKIPSETGLNNQNYYSTNQPPSNIDDQIVFYYHELIKNSSQRTIWGKIWKWMKAHSGTSIPIYCGLKLPCGDCAGMCLVANSRSSDILEPVEDDYRLTQEEYEDGERLIQLCIFNDTLMGMHIMNDDIVTNDTVIITEDFFIGHNASQVLEKDSIIILEGEYPVSYAYGAYGTTLVKYLSLSN